MKKFLFSVNVCAFIPMMLFMVKIGLLFSVDECVFITTVLFMVKK